MVHALLFAATVLPAQPAPWKKFVNVEGKFEATMPGDVHSKEMPTSPGSKLMMTASATIADGHMFMVTYIDYKSMQGMNLPTIQDMVQGGLLDYFKGKVLESRNCTFAGMKGVEAVIELKSPSGKPSYLYWRGGLSGIRLYQLMASSIDGNTNLEWVSKFWNSFKLRK